MSSKKDKPQKMFNKFIGNSEIKKILRRMLAKNRVPHSLLFAGEEGIGKKHFALELAKAFVCQNPIEFESCGKCFSCYRADNFTFPKADDREAHKKVIFSEHADIGQIIAYNKNILVDALRDLEKESNFRPFEAKARFFIIDDADKMNKESSNALLKTLEEPAASSYIFLITSRPDSLLQTILSRCQVLRFAPLSKKEIEKHLLETKQFAPADAEFSAQISMGSFGRALQINPEKMREIRGRVLRVLESLLIKNDRAFLLKTSEELNDAKNKENYEIFLEILQTAIHDLWLLRLGAEEIINADIANQLKNLAENSNAQRIALWIAEIEKLHRNFTVNLNKKIATDAIFMQMASR